MPIVDEMIDRMNEMYSALPDDKKENKPFIIRFTRRSLGLKVKAFSKMTGYSVSEISAIENGEQDTSDVEFMFIIMSLIMRKGLDEIRNDK